MKNIFYVLIIILIVIIGLFLSGYVFSILWHWFVVPLGVESIGALQGVALLMMLRMATYQHTNTDKKDIDKVQLLGSVVGWSILGPLVILGIGRLIYVIS